MAANGASLPPPVQTVHPSNAAAGVDSITQHGFRITTRKLPILKAGPIEEMTEKLQIAPPEMIFGDNYVEITHKATGWSINFNAFDALDLVDKTGNEMLRVAHSKEWQTSRQHHNEEITQVVKPFDWSYTTPYSGTVSQPSTHQLVSIPSSSPAYNSPIPTHLLRLPDPILFFSEVVLYEDELADNGISLFTIKIRVMPQRLLLLAQFFLRLDGVIVRVRDTRVYVEFGTGEVVREWTARETEFEEVKRRAETKLRAQGIRDVDVEMGVVMREPARVVEFLDVVERRVETVKLPVG
ncbi:MAG: hypothetical protein M1820_002814 [Bogoriella megaspora]|nr:MAG: hypothetical protein M1820_002814 [Bogoriella megaspora]